MFGRQKLFCTRVISENRPDMSVYGWRCCNW